MKTNLLRLHIHECLLDADNTFDADGKTIGERVRSNKHEHLWEDRREGVIDTIVIHYTSAIALTPRDPYNLNRILKIFCDYDVSSHYLITRRGTVYRCVPEEKKAWHCGGSIMPPPDRRTGVNEFSIGIELMATDHSGFSSAQYRSLVVLCIDIEKHHRKRFTYVGHDQIAGTEAVNRSLRKEPKVDPGPFFDWNYFRDKIREYRKRH
jgi:N-acetyl-anhydromuramyl-L-alanine amidase AmpD